MDAQAKNKLAIKTNPINFLHLFFSLSQRDEQASKSKLVCT